jgi:hypothetical protein
MPPLPRSREGNESLESHCHGESMAGRRVSRQPEAGKPIHRDSSRGDFTATLLFTIIPTLLHQPAIPVCKDACGSSDALSLLDHAGISPLASRCHYAIVGMCGDKRDRYRKRK